MKEFVLTKLEIFNVNVNPDGQERPAYQVSRKLKKNKNGNLRYFKLALKASCILHWPSRPVIFPGHPKGQLDFLLFFGPEAQLYFKMALKANCISGWTQRHLNCVKMAKYFQQIFFRDTLFSNNRSQTSWNTGFVRPEVLRCFCICTAQTDYSIHDCPFKMLDIKSNVRP